MVVRQGENRDPLPYNQSVKDIGFLVDYYMPRRQVSAAIVNTLELSEYSAVYKRNGS